MIYQRGVKRMHGYLQAIGFKEIIGKKNLRNLLDEVIESPTEKRVMTLGTGERIAEIRKAFAEGVGILIYGYYDEDEFIMEYYIPYIKGNCDWVQEDITITRHLNRESFAGACEDTRMGVTLVYHLENGMEYLENAVKGQRFSFRSGIRLAALSTYGMVLLPINKNERQKEKSKQAVLHRRKLISAAKNGDESAMESLTIEDIDTYSKISKRVRREDIFSIVDTSFMPYGVECDQYSVIGEILESKSYVNSYTGEQIFYLTLECNDIRFNVGINRDDLIGEPEVGMRFKGSIWLQGTVEFE